MSKHFSKKPLAIALTTAFAFGATAAQASVFQATDLGSGYMVAMGGHDKAHEGKCGEGKCGEAMFKTLDADGNGSISKDEFKKHTDKMKAEGKCGEGKCGGDKKKAAEGKCGEGKCGEKK
jgi:uncharacterized low-complexity protein